MRVDGSKFSGFYFPSDSIFYAMLGGNIPEEYYLTKHIVRIRIINNPTWEELNDNIFVARPSNDHDECITIDVADLVRIQAQSDLERGINQTSIIEHAKGQKDRKYNLLKIDNPYLNIDYMSNLGNELKSLGYEFTIKTDNITVKNPLQYEIVTIRLLDDRTKAKRKIISCIFLPNAVGEVYKFDWLHLDKDEDIQLEELLAYQT